MVVVRDVIIFWEVLGVFVYMDICYSKIERYVKVNNFCNWFRGIFIYDVSVCIIDGFVFYKFFFWVILFDDF